MAPRRRKLRSPPSYSESTLTIPSRPTPRRRKGEKKEINGKWKTPIGFCGVFVQQIQHRFSHRLQSRAGGGEGERDRSGRTPIERCKLLLKASQLCAGGRAKIHSPQSGWSGAEGARSVWSPSLCSPSFICFHFVLRHDGNSFIAAATAVGGRNTKLRRHFPAGK